jgi:hypothetical protein
VRGQAAQHISATRKAGDKHTTSQYKDLCAEPPRGGSNSAAILTSVNVALPQ